MVGTHPETTLSRVFGLFNGVGTSRLPANARVHVRIGHDVLDSAKVQDRGRPPVRIFNRDVIDDSLQRDGYTQAPALFIVGHENIRLAPSVGEGLNGVERQVVAQVAPVVGLLHITTFVDQEVGRHQ